MSLARIELTTNGDDDSRRRRKQRIKALAVIAGLVALAFSSEPAAEPRPEPRPDPGPALRLTPDVADFGSRDIGSASKTDVTLSNATKTPFVVAGIVAEGVASQDDFRIDATRCAQIDAGANCTATVSFTPHAAGPQSANFRIIDAANAASETIVARGVGTEIPPPPPPPPPQPQPSPPPPVHPRVTPTLPTPPRPVPQTTATEEPPPNVTETTATAEPTQTAETTATEAPATTTTAPAPPPRSRFKDTLKKIGRIAIPVVIGAAIANNTRDHGGKQDQKQDADRRIDVSPRSLNVTERSVVTVTNVGRDEVTINSIQIEDQSGLFWQTNDCRRTLAPRQQCRVSVSMKQLAGVRATLVVDSNAGHATVGLAGSQQYNPR